MIVKINKQKLIMEEVEQFGDISIEDLAEGACVMVVHAKICNRGDCFLQSCLRTLRATLSSRMSSTIRTAARASRSS